MLSAVLKTQSVSMWQRLHQSHYNSSILVQKAARLCVLTSAAKQHGSGSPADCPSFAWSVTMVDLSITTKCILFIHSSANCSTTTAAPALVHRWSPETTVQVVRIKLLLFCFMDSVWCFEPFWWISHSLRPVWARKAPRLLALLHLLGQENWYLYESYEHWYEILVTITFVMVRCRNY